MCTGKTVFGCSRGSVVDSYGVDTEILQSTRYGSRVQGQRNDIPEIVDYEHLMALVDKLRKELSDAHNIEIGLRDNIARLHRVLDATRCLATISGA